MERAIGPSDEQLLSDLQDELTMMLRTRNEPMNVKVFTLTVMKAFLILRGKRQV